MEFAKWRVRNLSVTPGLLLTHEIDWQDRGYKRPRWHVTHAGTSQKITGESLPKSHARLIAGALGGLPIDWTLKTQQEVYNVVVASVLEPYRTWLVRTLR